MKQGTLIHQVVCCGWLVAFAGITSDAIAAEGSASSAEKKPDAPATYSIYTIASGALKPKLQFDAMVEAVEMMPVKLEPKTWTDLTVLEAVPHGARIRRGERLVKLDTEKLKEQIDDLEQEKPASALTLELAQSEVENLKQTTPLKLEAARRGQRNSDEDLAYFEKIGRAQREKGATFNVKNAEQRLEGAKEELTQLEKMYKADDLTEETEEIILKRQKFAVESAEFGLESSRLQSDLSLKTSIPREHEALKNSKRDQELALTLAEQTLPKTLSKKQIDLEKSRRDQKKAEKKLADLKRDLESLSVTAPMDGIVYYGACENGKWTTGAAVAKKLVPNGKLTGNEVFMTVVKPDKLLLRAVITESDLAQAKPGMEGTASPIAAPERKIPVKLDRLDEIPLPGGGFDARLSLAKTDGARLVPGMNCKVSLGESKKADALLAPKDAVFTEGKDSHVFLAKGNAKPEKREVTIGETDGKMVQILSGLTAGDKILLQKPE